MNQVKFCKKCLINTYIPNEKENFINDKGICCYCEAYEMRKNELCMFDELQPKFDDIINIIQEKSKYEGRKYDFICPLSGGKDSSYILYMMKKKYNAKILSITIDNGVQDPAVIETATRISNLLNVDNKFVKLDKDEYEWLHTKLDRPCSACVILLWYSIYNIALEYNIPAIIFGDSRDQMMASYGINFDNYPDLYKEFHNIEKPDGYWNLYLYPTIQSAYEYYTKMNEGETDTLLDIFPNLPTMINKNSELYYKVKNINIIPYFYYHPHNEKQMVKILNESLDWQVDSYRGYLSHPDCVYHNFFPTHEFDIKHLSVYIREGIITREEAINDMQKKIEMFCSHDNDIGLKKAFKDLDVDYDKLKSKNWFLTATDYKNSGILRKMVDGWNKNRIRC